MTTSFTDNFELLLSELRAAEQARDLTARLRDEGGQHLISITIAHPDPAVKEAAERVARDMLPLGVIVSQLAKIADKAAADARTNLYRQVDASRAMKGTAKSTTSVLHAVPASKASA